MARKSMHIQKIKIIEHVSVRYYRRFVLGMLSIPRRDS